MSYKENPKTAGSGIVCCIPQRGQCPMMCSDCFFQSGRSYLEPLSENLPNIPPDETAIGRVVRMNDGNDSNHRRLEVEKAAGRYDDVFFNTSSPERIEEYPAPVVLTLNPAKTTDKDFHKVEQTDNLMMVRFRTNTWNLELLRAVLLHYDRVPVVATFMAYYNADIPSEHKGNYTFKQRTINSYWVLRDDCIRDFEYEFFKYKNLYTCGHKGTHPCSGCGVCLMAYYAAKERMK